MIYADYYGTCGVRGFLQGPGSQFIEVSRSAKLQQLKEINSCIEGLMEGGATEILVWDNDPGNPDQTPLNVYSLAGKNTRGMLLRQLYGLQKELKFMVEKEEYELAAKLRDEIAELTKLLSGEGEKA